MNRWAVNTKSDLQIRAKAHGTRYFDSEEEARVFAECCVGQPSHFKLDRRSLEWDKPSGWYVEAEIVNLSSPQTGDTES